MENKKKRDYGRELRITGVKQSVKDVFKNVAANAGIDVSQLLRPELIKLAESYPDHLKKPPLDY